jgi:hypothetical protein
MFQPRIEVGAYDVRTALVRSSTKCACVFLDLACRLCDGGPLELGPSQVVDGLRPPILAVSSTTFHFALVLERLWPGKI